MSAQDSTALHSCQSLSTPAEARGNRSERDRKNRRSAESPRDDADRVERARRGDSEAFCELFRAHRSEVARLAHRLLGNRADLDDVVQDVFLQVHRSLHHFRGQARFSTWLYRVTVNVVLMNRRAAKSRPVFAESADHHVFDRSDDRPLPDEHLSRQMRTAAFMRLVSRLSEKQRVVYVLHELEGIPMTDIAAIVEAPAMTVRTRLFYARRRLLQMFGDEPVLLPLVREAERRASHDDTPRARTVIDTGQFAAAS
jgi:RNA polymerase sigma-70 factor (ECF subfamily)